MRIKVAYRTLVEGVVGHVVGPFLMHYILMLNSYCKTQRAVSVRTIVGGTVRTVSIGRRLGVTKLSI